MTSSSGSGARRLARAFGSPVAALGSIGCRAQRCIYIYIYMYVCMYVCIYIYIYMYTCTYYVLNCYHYYMYFSPTIQGTVEKGYFEGTIRILAA